MAAAGGRMAKGLDLLGAIAAILPGFTTVAELGGSPRPCASPGVPRPAA